MDRVAVKELKSTYYSKRKTRFVHKPILLNSSYYNKEDPLCTINPYYLIQVTITRKTHYVLCTHIMVALITIYPYYVSFIPHPCSGVVRL